MFSEYSWATLTALGFFALIAGFLDAVVGGGGLIQLPALLINFPKTPLPTLLGTSKMAGFTGTSFAAWNYAKRVRFDFRLLLAVSAVALAASWLGARTVGAIPTNTLKPVILVILVLMVVYTLIKKDLGAAYNESLTERTRLIRGILLGLLVGFYDGFLGPGAGSFLVLGFVAWTGFDFLMASAYSKIVNVVTNVSALFVFVGKGNYLLEIALLMAVANTAGGIIGSRMAIQKGNSFIRVLFIAVVSLLIVRYGYDVFWRG